ncbi:MAG TPA: hypothetical protein VIR01_01470 [Pyrinomonadaceae bacterium]
MQRLFLFVITLAAMALLGSTASAALIVSGNVPQNDEENILFNEPGLIATGTTVQGLTNQTQAIVNFTGTEELTTPAQGQARIEATDGGFDNLTIALAPPGGVFHDLILNLNADADGFVTFFVDEGSGLVEYDPDFDLDANGENFFTLTSDTGFTAVKFVTHDTTVDVELDDLRQIRISGVQPNTPIPEASSIAAWGICAVFGAFVAYRRRRAC